MCQELELEVELEFQGVGTTSLNLWSDENLSKSLFIFILFKPDKILGESRDFDLWLDQLLSTTVVQIEAHADTQKHNLKIEPTYLQMQSSFAHEWFLQRT